MMEPLAASSQPLGSDDYHSKIKQRVHTALEAAGGEDGYNLSKAEPEKIAKLVRRYFPKLKKVPDEHIIPHITEWMSRVFPESLIGKRARTKVPKIDKNYLTGGRMTAQDKEPNLADLNKDPMKVYNHVIKTNVADAMQEAHNEGTNLLGYEPEHLARTMIDYYPELRMIEAPVEHIVPHIKDWLLNKYGLTEYKRWNP